MALEITISVYMVKERKKEQVLSIEDWCYFSQITKYTRKSKDRPFTSKKTSAIATT